MANKKKKPLQPTPVASDPPPVTPPATPPPQNEPQTQDPELGEASLAFKDEDSQEEVDVESYLVQEEDMFEPEQLPPEQHPPDAGITAVPVHFPVMTPTMPPFRQMTGMARAAARNTSPLTFPRRGSRSSSFTGQRATTPPGRGRGEWLAQEMPDPVAKLQELVSDMVEIQQIYPQLQDALFKLHRQEAAMVEKDQRISQLQYSLSQLTTIKTSEINRLKLQLVEVAERTQEADKAEEYRLDLESSREQILESQNQLEKLSQQCQELQVQAQETGEKISELYAANIQLEAERKSLVHDAETASAEVETLEALTKDLKDKHEDLASDNEQLQVMLRKYAIEDDTCRRGDPYFIDTFSALSHAIVNFSNDNFQNLPIMPPPEVIAQLPENFPQFWTNNSSASKLLRAAYIQHTISNYLCYRVYDPFLFSLGKRHEKTDSLFHAMSSQMREKSLRKEATWRYNTLLAAYTSVVAGKKASTLAQEVIDEIVWRIRPFADPSRLDFIQAGITRIVKTAVETWRYARLEREMITATMPVLGAEGEFASHNYGVPDDGDGTNRIILLGLLPQISREGRHASIIDNQQHGDTGKTFTPGVVLYRDSPPVVQRQNEMAGRPAVALSHKIDSPGLFQPLPGTTTPSEAGSSEFGLKQFPSKLSAPLSVSEPPLAIPEKSARRKVDSLSHPSRPGTSAHESRAGSRPLTPHKRAATSNTSLEETPAVGAADNAGSGDCDIPAEPKCTPTDASIPGSTSGNGKEQLSEDIFDFDAPYSPPSSKAPAETPQSQSGSRHDESLFDTGATESPIEPPIEPEPENEIIEEATSVDLALDPDEPVDIDQKSNYSLLDADARPEVVNNADGLQSAAEAWAEGEEVPSAADNYDAPWSLDEADTPGELEEAPDKLDGAQSATVEEETAENTEPPLEEAANTEILDEVAREESASPVQDEPRSKQTEDAPEIEVGELDDKLDTTPLEIDPEAVAPMDDINLTEEHDVKTDVEAEVLVQVETSFEEEKEEKETESAAPVKAGKKAKKGKKGKRN